MSDNKPSVPRVTFGVIVLNGEPFTRYCLRALYPFAHEIIVVEGACEAAANIATRDGHSIDGTLETLRKFKIEEDKEDKIKIIQRDGFWREKDEQSQTYANAATGDYLWQVDIDEFYLPEDMTLILNTLRDNSSITAVSFKQIQFWGGFDYYVDGWYLKRGVEVFHRLFKWNKGYVYKTHRPPTVLNSDGKNTRDINWITAYHLEKNGIFLYHYSLVFPKQVKEKCEYYGAASWANRPGAQKWVEEVFLNLKNPYRVHNVYAYPSWLERFQGKHPPQIERMKKDLETGELKTETRGVDDIEQLLNSTLYPIGRAGLKIMEPIDRRVWRRAKAYAGRIKKLIT